MGCRSPGRAGESFGRWPERRSLSVAEVRQVKRRSYPGVFSCVFLCPFVIDWGYGVLDLLFRRGGLDLAVDLEALA